MKKYFFLILLYCTLVSTTSAQELIWKQLGEKNAVIHDVKFSRSGHLLAFTNGTSVEIVKSEDYQQVAPLHNHKKDVFKIAFSDEEDKLLSASKDLIIVTDLSNRKPILTISNTEGKYISDVAFSNDGKLIAASTMDGIINIYHSNTGDSYKTFKAHEGMVSKILFTDDDRYLVSAGQDGVLKVWGTGEFDLFKALKAHSDVIRSFAISPDNQYIASCGDDKSIFIWDIFDKDKTSPVHKVHNKHKNWITDIAYQSDGNFLLTLSHDNKIRIHPLYERNYKNLKLFRKHGLKHKLKIYPGIHDVYFSKLAIKPGTFELIVATNGKGIYMTKYLNEIYNLSYSLLK